MIPLNAHRRPFCNQQLGCAEQAESAQHQRTDGIAYCQVVDLIAEHPKQQHGDQTDHYRRPLRLGAAAKLTQAQPYQPEPQGHQTVGQNNRQPVRDTVLIDIQQQAKHQRCIAQSPLPHAAFGRCLPGCQSEQQGYSQGNDRQGDGEGLDIQISQHVRTHPRPWQVVSAVSSVTAGGGHTRPPVRQTLNHHRCAANLKGAEMWSGLHKS